MQVKTGRKRGDRYSDGTEWGENWFEEHRPATAHTKTDAEEVPTDASASFRPPPGSQPPASLLRLRVRHWDKWWKEPTGNRWGEKLWVATGDRISCDEVGLVGRYEDLESGGERHEKWYDNGFERQVDRWELRPDGSKSGGPLCVLPAWRRVVVPQARNLDRRRTGPGGRSDGAGRRTGRRTG